MVNSKYWVWLSAIPKIGPRKRMQLIEHFSGPENVWQAARSELQSLPFLNEETVSQLLNTTYRENAEKHLENIKKYNIAIININDEAYPYYLKNIHDPPMVLYVRGNLLKEEKYIAVVGSRRASSYGLNMAATVSSELTKLGITVVSGMARGIDSCAHNAALKAGGRTIGVLGCGPDIIYPSENENLMKKIISSGAIISEYIPGTPPLALNFPARNRIISGTSLGVIVVEAGEKSGSLITADFALEQGREVFAIPGNLSSFNSKGTNKLIREGAKIVTCLDDILEELNVSLQGDNNVNTQINDQYNFQNNNQNKITKNIKYKGLQCNEMEIVKQLELEPLHIDLLAKKCGLNMQTINSLLIMLEMKGIIEQLPGKVIKLIE